MAVPDLATLLAPTSVDRFLADRLGRAPLHLRHGPGLLAGLPDAAGLLALVAEAAPGWPVGRIAAARDGRYVAETQYGRPGPAGGPARVVDPVAVSALVEAGCSIVLRHGEWDVPGILSLCEAIEKPLGGYAYANLYHSQPDRQALSLHCDPTDVFVVQLDGYKAWTLYEGQAVHPRAGLSGDEAERLAGAVALEPILAPGDVLYVPRGRFHHAVAVDGPSFHVTISLDLPSGADLVGLFGGLVDQDPALRAYVDPAADVEGGILTEAATRRLLEHLARLSLANVDALRQAVGRHYAEMRRTRNRPARMPRRPTTPPRDSRPRPPARR